MASINVYIGADISLVLAATNVEDFFTSARNFLFTAIGVPGTTNKGTDPVARLSAIAGHIVAGGADVVGLQEVATYRVLGIPGSGELNVNFESILMAAIAAQGGQYRVVSRQLGLSLTNIPLTLQPGVDLAVTMQVSDLLLVKDSISVSEVASGNYVSTLTIASPLGEVAFRRQWVAATLGLPGSASVRVISTHLESGDAGFAVRNAQANELIALVQSLPASQRLVLMGDWNSDPRELNDASARMVAQLNLRDSWIQRGSGPGYTFGHDGFLQTTDLYQRIDYITGSRTSYFTAASVRDPMLLSVGPKWPSDHLQVWATVAFQ